MDPIVAPATRLINQPVGILRISGSDLLPRFSPLFVHSSGKLLPEPRHAYRVRVHDQSGEPVDDGILLYFRAPSSLTGEDVLEFQLHGNPHCLRRVMDYAIELGARPARPGEFLYRSYLHHKISLLKAESLNRLIQAPSFQDYRRQFSDYSAKTPGPLEEIRLEWVNLMAQLYVLLDHSDLSDSELPSFDHVQKGIDSLLLRIDAYRRSYKAHKSRWQGFSVALLGPPNSGKSSLFNRLLGNERAIVSEVPGTTRDMIEGKISTMDGDILIVDSAGLRKTNDPVEQKGIQKSLQAIRHATLVLLVESSDAGLATSLLPDLNATNIYRVWNKSDLGETNDSGIHFRVSARTRKGIPRLYRFLEDQARSFYAQSEQMVDSTVGLVSSERQYKILSALSRHLKNVRAMIGQVSWEIVLHELETQKELMEDAVGIVSHSMVYDRVFQGFCIGK